MDRRFHQRYSTDLPVLLTLLDDGVESSGQLEDISDSGICSLFPISLAPGAIVKLEILGLTLYGQVAYSNPEDGTFRTGVFVEPALLDSSNITELVQNYIISTAGQR
ncbi:MAG: PilZ domain-containing protein [Bryobacteraceae bacterium]